MEEVDVTGWYRRFGEAVYRRCLRIVGEEALAMDLMQETFLRAHKYQRSYRGQSPLSWLLTIADRCAFDGLKRRTQQPLEPDEVRRFLEAEEATSAHAASGAEPLFQAQALVPRLLASADETTRQIVLHRYFDELELEEIAQRLDINERTVRRRLERFLTDARAYAERS